MKNFYFEGSKNKFTFGIDADICKMKALIELVKSNEQFTGRLEDDYISGLNHCIALLDNLRIFNNVLIKYEGNQKYRPIKNTSKDECYAILYHFQTLFDMINQDNIGPNSSGCEDK